MLVANWIRASITASTASVGFMGAYCTPGGKPPWQGGAPKKRGSGVMSPGPTMCAAHRGGFEANASKPVSVAEAVADLDQQLVRVAELDGIAEEIAEAATAGLVAESAPPVDD